MKLIFASLFVLIVGSLASAGDCRKQVIVEQQVAIDPYVAVQTVLIPSYVFQYLPAFSPPGFQYQYGQPQAPQAQQAPVDPGQPMPQALPERIPAPTPDTTNPAPAPSSTGLSPEAILRKDTCVNCHTFPGKKGIVFFDQAGRFAPNVSARRIWNAADGQAGIVMPPDAAKDSSKAVPDQDLRVLRDWMMQEK